MKFDNKVVFVTGAAQGMGFAIVRRFAAEGASVVAADINAEAAARAVADLGERGLAVACNVADSASVAEAFQAVESRFGRVDVVVNSAGIGSMDSFVDTPRRSLGARPRRQPHRHLPVQPRGGPA